MNHNVQIFFSPFANQSRSQIIYCAWNSIERRFISWIKHTFKSNVSVLCVCTYRYAHIRYGAVLLMNWTCLLFFNINNIFMIVILSQSNLEFMLFLNLDLSKNTFQSLGKTNLNAHWIDCLSACFSSYALHLCCCCCLLLLNAAAAIDILSFLIRLVLYSMLAIFLPL